MSRGINKAILVGNLGADPELKSTQGGNAVCVLSVATSESWKDKQTGESQEKTERHRVVLFNRLGEIAGEYLKKGSQVYIEGQIKTRKWQDQQGQNRYTTEIIAREMQMLGHAEQGSASRQPQRSHIEGEAQRERARRSAPPADETMPYDDVPF